MLNIKRFLCILAALSAAGGLFAKGAKKPKSIDKAKAATPAADMAQEATAQEEQVIGRYYGPKRAYRVDVLDDGTFQYFFRISTGEFIHYAHGTYSGNINAPGTVAIRLSQYLHDYEWVTIPGCFGTCLAVLADDGKGAMAITNWSDVESWSMRIRGQ